MGTDHSKAPSPSTLNFSHLPEEILLKIFSLVPGTDLIRHCSQVCTQWRDVINSPALWKRKCQDMRYISKKCQEAPKDWKLFYYLSSKRRNFLRNPCATDGFKFWKIGQNRRDQWQREEYEDAHAYFASTFRPCKESHLIDLTKMGYGKTLLDVVQPDIVISEWYAGRRDCVSQYEVCIQLLSAKKKLIKELKPERMMIEQWSDDRMGEIKHTFRNYGPGVRYVYFQHRTKAQQLEDQYGILIFNSSISIEPEYPRS